MERLLQFKDGMTQTKGDGCFREVLEMQESVPVD
jgi:hypothetical protein